MEFRYEDLPQAGLILVPPSPAEPAPLLVNRSGKPLAASTLIQRYQHLSGRTTNNTSTAGTGTFPSLLLPFGINEQFRKWASYWTTILPGSKRRVIDGQLVGDNFYVRPPTPEEEWEGGTLSMGGGGGGYARDPNDHVTTVTLVLDSVFFTDGEFVGANTAKLWQTITRRSRNL